MERLKEEFMNPGEEFSPIPFWFWNDDINQNELSRQIKDFKLKGVDGFVIHPRMGIPKKLEYLSERFMKFVKYAVQQAAEQNMKVVLYDEAMYPSGSAHGAVSAQNPMYASRGLKRVYSPQEPLLNDGDEILYSADDVYYISCFTNGTIRGIHFGEDDCEQYAPKSSDLLNDKAVKTFIALTYERYYEFVGEYFGNTIIGFFTDEPCIVGRGVNPEMLPWTYDFLEWYVNSGGSILDIPKFWSNSKEKELYQKAVSSKLENTYYKPISTWCEKHNIALMGHPGESNDIELLRYFHIPGQDLVLRRVAPEENKSISGIDSTQAKCSSDSARHSGKRRNSNECFGACNKDDIPWNFTTSDMKWYIDWLCVRGVNMLIPHAFYYSIEGERKYERPPDVGPNNIWWEDYKDISTYIKRLCWLMTDSINVTELAVVCASGNLPWQDVAYLYQHQIEFNYLEKNYINEKHIRNDYLEVNKNKYSTIFVPDGMNIANDIMSKLKSNNVKIVFDINQIPNSLNKRIEVKKNEPNLRFSHVKKGGIDFYLFVNEGEHLINNEIIIYNKGHCEVWDAFTGEIDFCDVVAVSDDFIEIKLNLRVRESVIVAVDPSKRSNLNMNERKPLYTKQVNNERLLIENNEQDLIKVLELLDINEYIDLYVNDSYVGSKMWSPYRFDITKYLNAGENEINVKYKESLAKLYGKVEINDPLPLQAVVEFFKN